MTTIDDTESFVVKLAEVIPPPEKPTIKAPMFTFVDEPFMVTGETPEPNQTVWIEITELLIDTEIARGVSDSNRKFEIEVTFSEVGFPKIHSEIDKPFDILDPLAMNPISPSVYVFVIDWWILLVLGALVLLIMYDRGMLDKILKKPKRRK